MFVREIAFNRVTEELKSRLTSSRDFNFWRAYSAIDKWNCGYIDKKNLEIFMRKNGSKATNGDCMAIIRRLDLDCDAKLSFNEFVDGLTPDGPFCRHMKSEEIKKED